MDYELISKQDVDGLPDDPEQCFVEFEAICRRNMTAMLDGEYSSDFYDMVRSQYMAAVYSVAQECGITRIPSPENNAAQDVHERYRNFAIIVHGEVARINIRNRGSRNPYAVLLTANTRTKIEHYVSRLRETIDTSDLSVGRKQLLNAKLDEFAGELANRRVGYAKTMAVLSSIVLVMGSVTTIAAEGPNAVTNIMKLLAQDKESEDAAASRLSPPARALPAPGAPSQSHLRPPAPRKQSTSWDRPTSSLDDEIPF